MFGGLTEGTIEQPAIVQESIHYFSKVVSGNALKRPAWFFDTAQQGEGIVDVTTHLIDLAQWEGFPEMILNKSDVQLISAKHWSTDLSQKQFEEVTKLNGFPEFLKKDVEGNLLKVYSNGEIVYNLKGKTIKVNVIWNFDDPDGSGDTHYSIMRGKLCNVVIKQGKEESFKPTVYIEANIMEGLPDFEVSLKKAIELNIAYNYPGLKLIKLNDKLWTVDIPDKYKLGHEAHFGQVTEEYLSYLKLGKLPEWEVPGMITKYYTTTEAMKLAKKQ